MMKERLDILLVDKRLVESRTKAQWLIKNGHATVNGVEIRKPGKRIDNNCDIRLTKEFPYVGRGGLKLEAALKEFSILVENKVCVDIGASIGGFTDCLLKYGASKVYAIDIAEDFLHPSLRCEKMKNRVIPLLGVDARKFSKLEEKIDICTVDITFASLKEILPNIKEFLNKNGDIVALVKPLFETEFHQKNTDKIILDSEKLYDILLELIEWSIKNNLFPQKIIKSPIVGKGASKEFLIHFKIDINALNHNYKNTIKEII